MKTKKIIQVVPGFNVGGAEALVKEYLIHFQKAGFDVEAFCTGGRKNTIFERELDEAGIKVVYLPELYSVSNKWPGKIKHILIALKWRAALKKYFKDAKPAVVHCHLSVARSLVKASKYLKKARLFYTVHSDPDKYWENGKNADERKAVSLLIKRNDLTIISLHKKQEAEIRKYYGDLCKIELVHNGVDFDKYKPSREVRHEMRRELLIPDDAFVVGHVGRFLEVKNHKFLVEVFRHIHNKNPNAMLCLVGDGELRAATAAQVRELGLDASVLFLGNRNDVPRVLSAFDVFVFPSIWEGFPITMIEAQAAGLPCYVSDAVNEEVRLSTLVSFLSLSDGTETWAKKISAPCDTEYEDLALSEYDFKAVLYRLTDIYGFLLEDQ